jgi:plasmid stability protein
LKVIQIRNVPDGVHRALRTRAAAADMTLSDLALEELTAVVVKSPVAEVLRRAEARGNGTTGSNVVAAVRATRETA